MTRPIKVLILEDVEADAELMIHELKREGFLPDWIRVDTENSYLTALASGPDLILSDFNLPQFDAFLALQFMQMQKLDIPFIVISGAITEDVAVEFMKRGASDYLLKDRMARLGQAVVRALEQRELREEKRKNEEALIGNMCGARI
jgi:DNA-binding NtrC family response regulator